MYSYSEATLSIAGIKEARGHVERPMWQRPEKWLPGAEGGLQPTITRN